VKRAALFLSLWLLGSAAQAGEAALSETTAVPKGERIANYLQSVITSAGQLVNAKNPGDIFSPKTPQSFSINYDPAEQVIDVDVLGDLDNFQTAQKMLDLTQQLVLSLNKKIEKYYGVTLTGKDLAMVYINAKAGALIAKYSNGKYEDELQGKALPVPTTAGDVDNNP